jgi:WD40 repeat protein
VNTGQLVSTFDTDNSSQRYATYSPDGKSFFTVWPYDEANIGQLWDLNTGKLLHTFNPVYGIVSVAYASDSKTILTAGGFTVNLWDVNSSEPLRTMVVVDGGFHYNGYVYSVAYAPDGKTFLTGADDKKAKLWDTNTWQLIRIFQVMYPVTRVAYSPDGKTILTAGSGGAALWDVQTGQMQRAICSH